MQRTANAPSALLRGPKEKSQDKSQNKATSTRK